MASSQNPCRAGVNGGHLDWLTGSVVVRHASPFAGKLGNKVGAAARALDFVRVLSDSREGNVTVSIAAGRIKCRATWCLDCVLCDISSALDERLKQTQEKSTSLQGLICATAVPHNCPQRSTSAPLLYSSR